MVTPGFLATRRSPEATEAPQKRRRALAYFARLVRAHAPRRGTPFPYAASLRPETMQPPAYVPAGEASAERGKYLAEGPAVCVYCHTRMDLTSGELVSQPFSGGAPEPDPSDPEMEIAAPNITAEGRLKGWSAEQFVTRMRAGRTVAGSSMPWENFRGMTDADLRSIYLYLKQVEPSDHDNGPSHREAR